jgi:hypothetical protein
MRIEMCRAGSLDVVKAQELGVFPGPEYAALKAGEPVKNVGMLLSCASVLHCDVRRVVKTHSTSVLNDPQQVAAVPSAMQANGVD